jgi:cell shape-determining protein MreC
MKTCTKLKTALFLAAAANMTYASESCVPPKKGQTPLDVLECLQKGLDTLTAKTEKQQKRIAELEKENQALRQKTDAISENQATLSSLQRKISAISDNPQSGVYGTGKRHGVYATNVVGVYSTHPGFVGGYDGTEGKIPLAVLGIVPVKASTENGPIRPGSLLVTSTIAGHAMQAGSKPQTGTVIGKAMEGLNQGTGIIKMLVILN